jgi:hypothetical protein
MVEVGEFEQFDGRAVFDYEREADAVGWAVGGVRISRPASSEARSATSNAHSLGAYCGRVTGKQEVIPREGYRQYFPNKEEHRTVVH